MNKIFISFITLALAASILSSCGPSEEEIKKREQARQDSLERVRQQRVEKQRQDSIAQARQDSIAAAKEREERNRIEFDSNGAFAVQTEAWRSREKAEAQVQKWVDRGYENAYVVKTGNEDIGEVWFRVRLGRVDSRKMAEKLREKLKNEYNAPSWISMASEDTAEDLSKPEQ